MDSPEEPINPNFKKWILRVSIHCEGCKKKVKKLLSQVPGVHEIDVDTRQHKVTVIGDVDASTLLRKLLKSGKQAELWPENPVPKEKKPAKTQRKVKEIATRQESAGSVSNVNEVKPSPSVKPDVPASAPPKEIQEGGGGGAAPPKVADAGKSTSAPVGGGPNGNLKPAGSNEPNDVAAELSKSEGKKPESDSGSVPPPSVAVAAAAAEEVKAGEISENATTQVPDVVGKVGVGNDGGSVKKKKSRGQKGNNIKLNEQQSSAAAEHGGSRNLENAQQNSSSPDHPSRPRAPPMYDHQYPPHYYGPPPAAAPMYATMSYNTAYPTSSYTASYYAPAPPNSYVHSYPVEPPVFQAPQPPEYDPYMTRQPLDSFEMFSDENPNGCLIM